jgi:transcriptional regulator with XRE-family HTH domain
MNDALRAALRETGLTTESLAEQVGVDRKTAARWLSEGRIPHARTRAVAAAVLGRDVKDIWPDTARRRELAWFRPWAEIERDALSLRWFELAVLPGLLQTEAYARSVLSGASRHGHSDIERILATRLARQGILTGEDPPTFTAVIDECVLRRPVGGPEVMHEQLLSIVEACRAPHVRVQVVPVVVGAYAGLNGPFVVATGADYRCAGYLDNQLNGQVVSGADETTAMLAAWDAVHSEALSHWQSVDLIEEVAKTWT